MTTQQARATIRLNVPHEIAEPILRAIDALETKLQEAEATAAGLTKSLAFYEPELQEET